MHRVKAVLAALALAVLSLFASFPPGHGGPPAAPTSVTAPVAAPAHEHAPDPAAEAAQTTDRVPRFISDPNELRGARAPMALEDLKNRLWVFLLGVMGNPLVRSAAVFVLSLLFFLRFSPAPLARRGDPGRSPVGRGRHAISYRRLLRCFGMYT